MSAEAALPVEPEWLVEWERYSVVRSMTLAGTKPCRA